MKRPPYAHGQFSWVDLNAHDAAAAIDFYGRLLGWTTVEQDTGGGPPYSLFLRDGAVVAGVGEMSAAMKAQGLPPLWNSYINVSSVPDVVAQAEKLGATVVVPPMRVLDSGWLAYVQDPTGASVGFWQAGTHKGAERVNVPGSFCWNELNTRDAGAACTFFHELLGWEYEDNDASPSAYFIIQNEGRANGGILQMTEEWGDIPPHWMVYFAVENIEASATAVRNLGGTLHHGPFDTPAGPIAVVADPQGATFHLIELRGAGIQ